MARKKQSNPLIRAINFGRKGELAWEIVQGIKKHKGNWGISEEVRKAIIFTFSNNKSFNQEKINKLIEERENLKQQVPEISKQLLENEKKLNKLGYKLKDLE